MKGLYYLCLFLVIILFLFGIYYLFLGYPGQDPVSESFSANVSSNLPENSNQFYPNMRYRSEKISYYIEKECDFKKENEIKDAFSILEEQTILNFYESSSNPEIVFLCSELEPEPEEQGHFVAGEGGPTTILNSSVYSVILSGKVSLYRDEKCDAPQIALHEILHALGFDHNNNKKSIMYPVTDCDEVLDQYIVDQINTLYSVESLPDLVIEKVNMSKKGRYLDFNITVSNMGLQNANNVKLNILADGGKVKEFDLTTLEIGTKKFLTVQNLFLTKSSDQVFFVVEGEEDDLNPGNNKVVIRISG